LAVHELTVVDGRGLFGRLPSRLFGPLAAPNRLQHWHLLCALYERRFGPDAPFPPSHGFHWRDIARDIEDEMAALDARAAATNEEPPATPLIIRANEAFHMLKDAGWLRAELRGVRQMVTMPPVVAHFMGMLVEFAQTGPVFVAGKVRSIEANLRLIVTEGAEGDTLQEAASQSRSLLEHVRNTGNSVRELMLTLDPSIPTATYVRTYFNRFIQRVFIGDYGELRTGEHPISRKQEIIQTVEHIHTSSDLRERLIVWYGSKRANGDMRRAELLFERDIQRLLDLRRIEEYLDRLDEEVRRANKQALVFLDFRLRALRPLDQLVKHAIRGVLAGAAEAAPFAPGELLGVDRLAEPRTAVPRPPPSDLRTAVISIEEQARARLMLRARDARTVTAPKLTGFVAKNLNGRPHVRSDSLDVAEIADVRAIQALSTIALAMSSESRSLRLDSMTLARGYTVERSDAEPEGAWVTHAPFVIQTRKRKEGGTR
jgi:hypothetical protein